MVRRLLMFVLLVGFILTSTFGRDVKKATVSNQQNMETVKVYVDGDGFLHKQVVKPAGEVFDTVEYLGNIMATRNDYTQPDDYTFVYYRPAAEGFFREFFVAWGSTGDVIFHVTRDSTWEDENGYTRAFGNIYNSIIDSINGFEDGAIWTVDHAVEPQWDVELKFEDYSKYTVSDATFGAAEEIPVEEYNRFWVGWKTVANGAHEIWKAGHRNGKDETYRGHSFFTYGGQMGPYRIVWGGTYDGDIAAKAVFRYPNGTPPSFGDFTQLNDTYAKDVNFTISAEILDADGEITSAYLKYSNDKTNWQSSEMTKQDDGKWYGNLTGTFNVGDTVFYYVEATDNDGKTRDNSNFAKYFLVTEPENKDAEILVIAENTSTIDYFDQVLKNIEAKYELWNTSLHNGLDKSIVNYPQWKYIIINANGSKYMFHPQYDKATLAAYSEVYKALFDFLDNGGGLFLSDPDYFYAKGAGTDTTMELDGNTVNVAIGELTSGMVGYDYLGVGKFWSDPYIYTDDYYPYGSLKFLGIADDPISGDWATDTLKAFNQALHWGDFVQAHENARTFIYDADYNYGAGVYMSNGNWATVFIPWDLSILCDTTNMSSANAEKFMSKVLAFLQTKTTDVFENDSRFITKTKLYANYPNPFNPETTIKFELAKSSNVELEIFDIAGRKIKTLVNEFKTPGVYKVKWNGTDNAGNKVATGVYFYKLKAGNVLQTKKMVMMK